MESMYDKLMNFPPFNGISHNQLSTLLEKTHLEFINYKPGELILDSKEEVNGLRFIISGETICHYSLFNGLMQIDEIREAGIVYGPERLFGLHRDFSFDIFSKNDTSLIFISKEEYVDLIRLDNIYLFNLLNYLSSRVQNPIDIICRLKEIDLEGLLQFIVVILRFTKKSQVYINCSDKNLAKILRTSLKNVIEMKEKLFKEEKINFTENKIYLKIENFNM